MYPIRLSVIATLMLALLSCSRNIPKDTGAAATRVDSITVYCDEAFRYLVDQDVVIYETVQPAHHLHMIYAPEAEVLRVLMTDSFSTVILGRKLTERERSEVYKTSHLQTEERSFARDAIAIVAHPDFGHDTLSYELVSGLIAGRSAAYRLVFEGNGSGVVSYMFSQFGQGRKPSAFAAKNMDELVSYLQKDKQTIGFIPFDRISDDDDSTARSLLKKVKLLSVARADSTGRIIVSTASQSEIADGSYPFSRPIVFIQHSMDENVGTGFVNFLYREQAGRIALKAGLIPAIMPQRVINVTTDSLK